MTAMQRPSALRTNAWNGDAVVGGLDPRTVWGQRPFDFAVSPKLLAPPPAIDLRDWRDDAVGWGVVLPENRSIDAAKRAAVDEGDAIAPLARLVERRGGVVVRYDVNVGNGYVTRYYPDGSSQQMSVIGSLPGTGRGALPMYLMIYAGPSAIPWSFQYQLNSDRFVGRLDPGGAGVEHYIAALQADWAGLTPDPGAPLVWTVNHGGGDITQLMSRVVGDALWNRFEEDADLPRRRRLADAAATGAALIEALARDRPAFVTTTSHGVTGPVAGATPLAGRVGTPVDADFTPVDLDALFGAWEPDGVIWYAHACCSAGVDDRSRFAELFQPGDPMRTMLEEVAASAGACTSPLAQRLLGAAVPARAFIGHIEPTFDWTLRDPATGQPLANTLIDGLYNQLFARPSGLPTPIGYALARLYDEADSFFAAWSDAIADVNRGKPGAADWALYRKLAGYDRQGTVILGDPAVSLPLPPVGPA